LNHLISISSKKLPIMVAVSGGVDSVALLIMLLRKTHPSKLRVVHYNHQLRGRQSDADERFVRQLAKKLGVKASFGKGNVAQFAQKNKLSIETAARQMRYAFFEKISSKYKIRQLYLAHHADDQIETFLQRLFRGTGIGGLTGIKPQTRRGKLLLHRPLLSLTKQQIAQYAKDQGLKWREDESNLHLDFNRNRVRHQLIPLAKDIFGRDITPVVLRLIEILDGEDEYMSPSKPPRILSVKDLQGQPKAIQRRMIHVWLSQTHKVFMPDFDEVESIRKLLSPGETSCRINLKKGLHVKRSRGTLKLEK